MEWALYNEVNANNTNNFSVYRCPDPVAVFTTQPWYPNSNICPCDPNQSNNSGRGYTACPLGISQKSPNWDLPASQIIAQLPSTERTVGNMYGSGNQFVPPQLQPRQLVRIGQEWRSAN